MLTTDSMKYPKNGTGNTWHILVSCAVVWIILCSASLQASEEEINLNAKPYLNQLKAEREESWLRKQMLKFGNFRHLDRAYQLTDEGRLSEAKVEFERYLINDHADLVARADYLHLLYRLKDYGNVLNQAAIILSQRPGYVPARMYRGFARRHLGSLEDAIEDFKQISATPEATMPDRILALNTASDLALQLELYSEALVFIQAIPEQNRNGFSWFRKGTAEEQTGARIAAADSYRQAIRSSRDITFKVTVHRALSDLAVRNGNWADAVNELKAALKLLPGDKELTRSYHLTSFESATRDGRYEKALEIAEILAGDSGEPAGWMRVGMTLEKLDRPKEAAAAYVRAEKLAGDKSQKIRIWQSIVEAAKKADDWSIAESALLNLQKLEPGKYETLHGLAMAAYRRQNLVDAVRWMESTVSAKKNPTDMEFLANLYTEAGEHDRAIEMIKLLLHEVFAPSDRHRHYMSLGHACSSAGMNEVAVAAFTSAAAIRDDPETLVQLAQSLENAGNLERAEEYRRRLVSIQPDAINHYALGMLYLKLEKEAGALEELEAAVHSGLDGAERFIALKQTASLYRKQMRSDKAEKALLKARSLNSGDASIPLMLAEIAMESGDYDAALDYADGSLADEQTVRGLKMRAQIYQKTGESNKALADYEKALSLLPENHPEASSFRISMGNLEFEANRYPEATEHFLKAFELDPEGDIDPLVQAAESLSLSLDWHAALEVNRKIIHLPQTSPRMKADAYRRIGILHGQLNQARPAEENLRNSLATGAADIRAYEYLGMLLFEQKRFAEARSIFSAMIDLKKSATGLLYLARTYAAMEKPGMAIYYLQQALAQSADLDPDDRVMLYDELGSLYAVNNQYAKAYKIWMLADDMTRQPEKQLRLARMQRLLGNCRKAQEILLKMDHTDLSRLLAGDRLEELALCGFCRSHDHDAIEYMLRAISNESTPARHYMLGLAYHRSNDPENAVVHLKQASDRQPLNDEYALALGYALRKAGRREEAVSMLETVATRSPGYLNAVKDLGYFHMQDSNNSRATLWFSKAIDNGPLYPQNTENEALEVQRDLYGMRSEVRSIRNRFDLAAYLSYRSNSTVGTAPVLGGGVLPSHGGLEISYQPPKIGYRAGRVFRITGRLLANTKTESLRPDGDSVQAGIGIRYKPIPQLNLFLSGEKMFKIGSNTYNGWLWRGMFSWTCGRDLIPGNPIRNYSLFYADAGYFTPNGGTTAVYSEIHQGIAFRIRSNMLLKPHAVIDGRYQDQDMSRGTYVEAGGGLSLQLFLTDTQYENHRIGMEFLGHYKRSWLQPNLQPQEDRITDGWTFTSILLF